MLNKTIFSQKQKAEEQTGHYFALKPLFKKLRRKSSAKGNFQKTKKGERWILV
jgi:hypothetical protein